MNKVDSPSAVVAVLLLLSCRGSSQRAAAIVALLCYLPLRLFIIFRVVRIARSIRSGFSHWSDVPLASESIKSAARLASSAKNRLSVFSFRCHSPSENIFERSSFSHRQSRSGVLIAGKVKTMSISANHWLGARRREIAQEYTADAINNKTFSI